MEWDCTVNDYKINAYFFIETEMLYHDYTSMIIDGIMII